MMSKRIAVVVRERQSEALRMAVGLILMDDIIHVYALDRVIEDTEKNRLNLETIEDMEMKAYSNISENKTMKFTSIDEIARKLLNYDHVLAY